MGKWVPRLARDAYPTFHKTFDSEVKYTKYFTSLKIRARPSELSFVVIR